MLMRRMRSKIHATAVTAAAWSNWLPPPVLFVWLKKNWLLLQRESEVSAKTVFDAVKAGDDLAIRIAERFGKYLGEALAIFACVVDPEVFVIGGGVSKAGPVLLDYIQKYYREYAFTACKDAAFALATLGNDAGIFGAAKMVL